MRPLKAYSLSQSTPRRHSTVTAALVQEQATGPAAQAHLCVEHVQSLTSSVRDTIAALQAENVRLKRRLLRERRATLEQFFMADNHLLKQAVIGEWWRFVKECRRMRSIEGIERGMHGDRRAYEARLVELEQQAQRARASRAEIEKEKESMRRRLERAEALIESVALHSQPYPMTMPLEIARGEGCRYVQHRLGGILREIDAGYAEYTPVDEPWEVNELEQSLRTQFHEVDVDSDGLLEWNSGEIQYFVCRVLQAAGSSTPAWDDRVWYTMYRQFDWDGSGRLDFACCANLARAVLAATETGIGLGSSWMSPATAALGIGNGVT